MPFNHSFWESNTSPDETLLSETRRLHRLRRADRYTCLCAYALDQLLAGRMELPRETALITASAFGPSATSFQTVMDIFDVPAEEISPTIFSHSVHNAANAYLGIAFDLHGPAYALTGFNKSLRSNALELAEAIVKSGDAPAALVVAIEADSIVTDAASVCYPEKFPTKFHERLYAALIGPSSN